MERESEGVFVEGHGSRCQGPMKSAKDWLAWAQSVSTRPVIRGKEETKKKVGSDP